MSIEEIKRNLQISKEHIERLEQNGMHGHILSLQCDYIEHLDAVLSENQRLLEAIRSAHQSLTWSNTENQVPHAIWQLEQVLNLPKGIESTASPSETAAV